MASPRRFDVPAHSGRLGSRGDRTHRTIGAITQRSELVSAQLTDPSTNPIERSIGLKKRPKPGDATLFWTSRSADAPRRLYTLIPPRNRYFLSCHGRDSEKSNVFTRARRPVRFRAPSKSWNSLTADHGNPERISMTGAISH